MGENLNPSEHQTIGQTLDVDEGENLAIPEIIHTVPEIIGKAIHRICRECFIPRNSFQFENALAGYSERGLYGIPQGPTEGLSGLTSPGPLLDFVPRSRLDRQCRLR